MWYTGHDWSSYRIWYATSSDWITWSKYWSNPVLDLGSWGSWDDLHVTAPSIIKNSDWTYNMFYGGNDGANVRIWYATSSDWTTWSRYWSNPVLDLGSWGSWDDAYVASPTLIKESDGTYKMWYHWDNFSNILIWLATLSWPKFWTTSMYFDWTWDYLEIPASSDFNFWTWDFTTDFWFNLPVHDVTNYPVFWTHYNSDTSKYNYVLYNAVTNNIVVTLESIAYNFPFTPSDNTWYHLATVRSWTSLKVFINWTQIWTTQTFSENISNSWNLFIWTDKDIIWAYMFKWYLDEIHISKWIARWTENFTPPTAPYWN